MRNDQHLLNQELYLHYLIKPAKRQNTAACTFFFSESICILVARSTSSALHAIKKQTIQIWLSIVKKLIMELLQRFWVGESLAAVNKSDSAFLGFRAAMSKNELDTIIC